MGTDLVFLTAHGAAQGVGAVAAAAGDVASSALAGVADIAGGAVETVGEAAGSVFSTCIPRHWDRSRLLRAGNLRARRQMIN